MAFSDDEAWNYFFVDDEGEPISFSVLPIKWSEKDISACLMNRNVYLHGIKEGGYERISKKVIAWKVDFSHDQPDILVLSIEKNWINLQKPRRSFEDTIRTILITIHCLHILKKHPNSSESSLWSRLQNNFSVYNVKPSEIDLLDHLPLICAAVEQDDTLAKSVFMRAFFEDPKKRKVFDEDIQNELFVKKRKFVSDNNGDFNEETRATNADESEEGWDMFDTVCAICDNGGELLVCDGRCLRSFHATVDAGAQAGCKSLDLYETQVKEMKEFLCMNCKFNQHQCFACGKLGSSDRTNNAEVFRCASATCGHFYHPQCVAKLLHPISEPSAEEVQKRIIAGESFICTVHKCSICKEEENRNVQELQFAICRRCPKVFHRKCLPREISFKTVVNEGIVLQRAWEELLPGRILIYCLRHKIDHSTLMPVGDHIIFPYAQENKRLRSPYLQTSQQNIATKNTSVYSRIPGRAPVYKVKEVQKVPSARRDHSWTKIQEKHGRAEDQLVRRNGHPFITPTNVTYQQRDDSKMNCLVTDVSRSHLEDRFNYTSKKLNKDSVLAEAKLDEHLKRVRSIGIELYNSKKQGVFCTKSKKIIRDVPAEKNLSSSPPSIDIEMDTGLVNPMEKISCSKTSANVANSQNAASTQGYSFNDKVDKAISPRKGEGSENAVQVSGQKLVGVSFDDTKADNDPEIVNYITESKIADKLHGYVQNGDTVVSLCSHGKDLSFLMRQRLEETGKGYSFKNFDIFQLMGEFDFMKKSWLSFCQKLDTGSRLIMGIKFPSEPKGVSVNQFIREVLNFKPKLLILICPKDMERDRLNGNESAYGLVWEDSEILSSESHLKETSCSSQQRKLEPPLLSLYSRLDWTKTYNTTALKLGHLSNGQNDFDIGTGHIGEKVSREPTDSNCFTDITNQINSIPEETSEEDRLTAQFDPNARAWTSMLFAPASFTLKNGSVGWLDD